MMAELSIEQFQPGDWEQVRGIYLEGITTGHATFEKVAPSWEAWDAAHLPFARLVARNDESVAGWAALSPVSQRCVYGGVAEVSVYVSAAYRRSGVGRALLKSLIEESERNGVWTPPGGNVSREHRQPGIASKLRLSRSRPARTNRKIERHLARHDLA